MRFARQRWGLRRVPVRRMFFRGAEEGSLLLESAIALLVIMPLVLWLFEICMLTYTCSVLGDAARQGVRYAIVHGADSSNCSGPSLGCGDSSGANVVAVVDHVATYSFNHIAPMKVEVSYPDGSSSPPARVNVTVDYSYTPVVALPGLVRNVHMTAQGRVIY